MKKRVWILLLVALTLSLVFSLAACSLLGLGGGNEGAAPVYKGMTVSSTPNGGTDTFIYAETYQAVYITVKLDNADNLVITSVAINGTTYEASVFESGSTREKIVVKVNVLNATGIVSYTLESVKYIDGKVIKDVTLSGDKTVHVGVYVPNQVSALVTEDIGFADITLNVTVMDDSGLIAFSNGNIKVELYRDVTLVEAKSITVGDNTVTFSGLEMGQWYWYNVVATYDDLNDGQGTCERLLYNDILKTKVAVVFGDVNVSYDGITFSFNWHEDAVGYSIKQLKLIEGNVETELSASATRVEGLYSNRDYTLIAYYDHNGATEHISYDFHTLEKHAPTMEVTNLWVEENLIRTDLNIVDDDNAGLLEVKLDGQKVAVNNSKQISLGNLNYGQTYQIEITYNYDLNDGEGEHPLGESLTVTTDSQTIHQTSCKLGYVVLNDSTCAVTRNSKCTHEVIDIPSTFDGYTVVEIRNFANSANLTSITLPDTVTEFSSGAFSDCKKLTSVNIPQNVTAISGSLFSGCIKLETVTFDGNNVTSIGANAFNGCTELASFTIPSSVATIGDGAFTDCHLTSITIPANVTSIGAKAFRGTSLQTLTFEADSKLATIGNEAFYELKNLTALAIPSSVEKICDYAFAYCTALQNLTFESDGQLRTIGNSAFYRCEQLTQLHLPSELYSIGDRAFAGINIATLTIPRSVVYIKAYAFASNSVYGGLQELIFENDSSLMEIGDEAFYWTRISSVAIPRSVMTLGANAFRKCTDLSQVEFGANSNLQTIGGGAFAECTSLRRITIPANVRTIGDSAFENCSAAVSFDSGSKLSTIGNRAFYGCRNISSITIPASVTSIGSYAFGDCKYLTAVTIPSSVVTIGERAFYGSAVRTVTYEDDSNLKTIGSYAFAECALSTITIPSSVTTVGEGAFQGCSGANTVTFNEGSQLTTIGAHAFEGCVAITEVVIPANVATIGESAFKGCSLLNTFTFEEGSRLQSIGANFFEGCNLITEIVIPASVTSIGAYAFQNLANLQAVQFETGSQLTTIGAHAFEGCSSLPNITLPEGLVQIYASVFYGCSALQWVVMPKSIKTIGNMAIERNSATIYYMGSYIEWCSVSMSSGDRNYFQEMYNNVYFFVRTQGYPYWYYDSNGNPVAKD